MPYRKVQVGFETFVTRINDSALEEWLENRDRLRVVGYPDRPPDIDTKYSRCWILHPNEQISQYISSGTTVTSTFPVYSLSFQASLLGGQEHKFLVTYDSDKEKYSVRLVAREENGETISDTDMYITHENISESFEEFLDLYASIILSPNDVPFIMTYVDFDEAEEEARLAEKELQDYYGKPLVN
jgi:hypothetical protein